MPKNPDSPCSETCVQLQDVCVRYGRIEALGRLSFSLRPRECAALLGLNGAGKTTAMRTLFGFLAPDAGTVRVFGLDPLSQAVQARRRMGYLPEENFLDPALTLGEHMDLFAAVHKLPREVFVRRRGELLERLQLGPVLHRLTGGLSRGYRQRAALALALLHDPGFVILDEPVTGLDPQQQESFHELVREIARERTVLLSTHLLSEARQLATRVLVLAAGKLMYDGPMTSEEILRAALLGEETSHA